MSCQFGLQRVEYMGWTITKKKTTGRRWYSCLTCTAVLFKHIPEVSLVYFSICRDCHRSYCLLVHQQQLFSVFHGVLESDTTWKTPYYDKLQCSLNLTCAYVKQFSVLEHIPIQGNTRSTHAQAQ